MTNYIITEFYETGFSSLIQDIMDGKALEISFPLSSINYSQSSLDIVYDYLETSFCCERIAPFIKILEASNSARGKHLTDFKIRCYVTQVSKFIEEIKYLSEMLSQEFMEYDDIDFMSFRDDIDDFEKNIKRRIFFFPDLLNGYWANMVNQGYWELMAEQDVTESTFLNRVYRKYPEQRFGFWKCPKSRELGDPVYFSTSSWIIPPDSDMLSTLKIYSGLENDIILEKADSVRYKNSTVLINTSSAIYFTHFRELICAINCIENALIKRMPLVGESETGVQFDIFGQPVRKRKHLGASQIEINALNEENVNFFLSAFGDLAIIDHKGFRIIFFTTSSLNFNELKELSTYINPLATKLQQLINASITGNCDWSELNDDSFEELCYDFLYLHPHFDSNSIQKMGKSRSRDGGRDIVIKSNRATGKESELYVFQCKFFRVNQSLSASKVQNAGNVILQYGAKGYGVFTTGLIDATLYDMLSGFSRTLNIDTSFCYSKYELERYLNRNDALRLKYFKALDKTKI